MQANDRSEALRDQRVRFRTQLERLIEAGVLSAAEADEALYRLALLEAR
jgi:hypothetical protein